MDRECIRHDEVEPAAIGILKLVVSQPSSLVEVRRGCERITEDVSERSPSYRIGDETQQLAGGAATLKVNWRPETGFVNQSPVGEQHLLARIERRLVCERRQHGLCCWILQLDHRDELAERRLSCALRVGREITCPCVVRTRLRLP